jgi:hypothetical protein
MTPQSKLSKLLILRLASRIVSGCAAIMIFAISLPAYAGALAEWERGNSYGQTLLLGLFLSVSAIGIVIIQANFEHDARKVLIARVVVGGMGSITLAVFTIGSFNPVTRILDLSNAVEASFFALATVVTVMRLGRILGIILSSRLASSNVS